MAILKTKILIRRGTDDTINNVILAVGEPGYNIESHKFAIGDGKTPFKDLLPSNIDLSDYVKGPASATDNAIARYNGATGKLIQNSNALLSDGGTLTLKGGINFDYANPITWASDTFHQRIVNVDDSNAGTHIIEFQQSHDGGKTFQTQASVRDDNGIETETYHFPKIGEFNAKIGHDIHTIWLKTDSKKLKISNTVNGNANVFIFPDKDGTIALTSDLPDIGNGTIIINQNGSEKGSFTLNQSKDTTINLTDTDTTYSAGDGLTLITGNKFEVNTKGKASGKTYPVTLDSDKNLIVSVPWDNDTNTTYTFEDGVDGFTVTPLGGTGQFVNVTHNNPGIEVNNDDSNISSKPFIKSLSSSGHTITVQRASLADVGLGTVYVFKGSKKNFAEIQAITDKRTGDVWNDIETGLNWAWDRDSDRWENLGGIIDTSNFVTLDGIQTITGQKTFSNTVYVDEKIRFKKTGNPLLDFPTPNNSHFYIQSFSNKMALGPTSAISTTWDLQGNMSVLGPQLTANKFVKKNGTATQILMADGNTKEWPVIPPSPEGYYWANVKISKNSNVNTKPTFSTVTTNETILVPRHNVLTSNLGNPSLFELSFIENQWTNKLNYHPVNLIIAERSTNNISYQIASDITASNLAYLVGGDSNTSIKIPCNHYLRLTFKNNGYVYLNNLYLYGSPGHFNFKIRIEKHNFKNNAWEDVINNSSATGEDKYFSNTAGGWPGHLNIRHLTIPWASNAHYDQVRVTIKCIGTVTEKYKEGYVYKMQWWGGYPAGKRHIWHEDAYQNIKFPAFIEASKIIKTGGTATQVLMANGNTKEIDDFIMEIEASAISNTDIDTILAKYN